MANNRLARTNDDIQRVLSELLRNVKDPRVQQGMISVTRVETTGDLRYAKVWLSVYRKELARSMNLRYTPELVFELDHSIEYGAHINELISSLDIRPNEEDTAEEAGAEEEP